MALDVQSPEPTLKELSEKIDRLSATTEKLNRYFQLTFWVTVVFFVLPLVGLLFAVPKFISTYSGMMDSSDVETQLNMLRELQGL